MEDGIPEILERLARAERDLEQMRYGLDLLGVRRCSLCKQFFQSSDQSALFNDGTELVCFGCIQEWWPAYSGTLEVADRQSIERKLVRWLGAHHRAEIIHQFRKLPDEQSEEFRFVADCDQCGGTGELLGAQCRYCGGKREMWIVIPKTVD